MEGIIKIVRSSLETMLVNGYEIVSIGNNDEQENDIHIYLKKRINIEYVSDKNGFECKIIHEGYSYSILDVLKILGVKIDFDTNDFWRYIKDCSKQIVRNEKEIELMLLKNLLFMNQRKINYRLWDCQVQKIKKQI